MNFDDLDEDDFDSENFVKLKNKIDKLTGRQTVPQLYLDALVRGIKTGKEASVYLGRNSRGLVAVKIYTDLRVRSFKKDQGYRQGRFIGDARIQKAIEQGSARGLDAHQMLWVQEELKQMEYLSAHGVRVPRGLAVHGLALVMEFIGDPDGTPAPRISDLHMDRDEAEDAFRQSVENLKKIVRAGRVHGDYSAFNILWHRGEAVVIDFPQVIEIKNNPNAHAFLERDVRSLCRSFLKQGVRADEKKVLREVRA
jgi:RIO kinase 1